DQLQEIRGRRRPALDGRVRRRHALQLGVLQTQDLGGAEDSVFPGDFRSRCPQCFRNRRAALVRTPPALEASANLLHAVWNIRRCLVSHHRSSIPAGIRTDLTNYGWALSCRLTERRRYIIVVISFQMDETVSSP